MSRTKLADRVLPDCTKGEEIANMVTHIIGAAFGVVALVLCAVFAARRGDPYRIVGSSVYGASLILLYTMSSVYHGLRLAFTDRCVFDRSYRLFSFAHASVEKDEFDPVFD